jgi:3-hydroxyisobutyrate dehydrogenase-like beta-hydroxyacid dehydrogenase
MSDITMIGLGAMGATLAKTFIQAGHQTTVWNRSAENIKQFQRTNAICALSLKEAIEASPIIIICIDNYDVTKQLFDDVDTGVHLEEKVLLQLSTGSPQEVSTMETWASEKGAEYLDGAIMSYPDGIGKESSRLLFSGPQKTYEQCCPFLACLGGDLRYLGENIVAAAVLDMALLTRELCGHLATVHGALICESEGVNINTLASMIEDEPDKLLAQTIHTDDFSNPGATINVWDGALKKIQSQASHRSINSEVPDLVSKLLGQAIDSGCGEEDFGAVIKAMRKTAK